MVVVGVTDYCPVATVVSATGAVLAQVAVCEALACEVRAGFGLFPSSSTAAARLIGQNGFLLVHDNSANTL